MKSRVIKILISFLFISSIIYIFFVHSGFMAINNSIGEKYTPSDMEVNYLTALSVYKGEGLYKNFSIVYPPGRFIVQAILFKIFGATVPTTSFFFNLPWLLFPTFLFFLTYKIFKKITASFFSFCLAIISTLTYLFFINSAQDSHVLSALFFIVSLSVFKSEKVKNVVLGILLGLVFLFRIETGIFILISILIVNSNNLKKIKSLYPAMFGFLLVWIPVLGYILFTGSFKNFVYDLFYLGLIVQPQMMSIPIPPPPSGYVYLSILIFIFSSALSLFINSTKQNNVKIFSLFSILSFASALGRSDDGHLWYGAVWLPMYVSYFILQASQINKFISKSLLTLIIPFCLLIYAYGYLIIKIKSVPLFILLTCVIFYLAMNKLKQKYAFIILVSGIITSLLIFHSISFLKLRFAGLPQVSFNRKFSPGLFQPTNNEIAGLEFSKTNMIVLNNIKNRLDSKQKTIFIFPNYVILYDYFKYKNPTRYFYHTGETTTRIEKEIIEKLDFSKSNNFIFFPYQPTNQKMVRQWILNNTKIDQVFMLSEERLELRKRKL